MPTDPPSTLEMQPGDRLTIIVPHPITQFRWPVNSFRVVCDTPQPLYRDPGFRMPASLPNGTPRLTPVTPMDVYAIFTGERALLVFHYPALWIDGDHARVV